MPPSLGRIRVRVAQLGGGARWFLRVYGELRQPGRSHTLHFSRNETAAGTQEFEIDPRLCRPSLQVLQLQLGVEGAAGAFAVFDEVAFLPAVPRPNCPPRTVFQPSQVDISAVELMPNLPQPFELINWKEKAMTYDSLVFDLSLIHISEPTRPY